MEVSWVCRVERAFWVVASSVRRRDRLSLGDCSCGAGDDVLPLTGVLVRSGSFEVDDGRGDAGAGSCAVSCDAVRSASLVSGSLLVYVPGVEAVWSHTGIYVAFVGLLPGISFIEGGGVLVDPVAHRKILLLMQAWRSLVPTRRDFGNILNVSSNKRVCDGGGRERVWGGGGECLTLHVKDASCWTSPLHDITSLVGFGLTGSGRENDEIVAHDTKCSRGD